eukprot:CAMPEP_0182590806 /NCGR_PEP_ID=MMETSP1324-20130603/72413_1 /TAXON_ID=236786 /ORGANISM="Florenciella sp., Strain RCC1587" /LENGTH=68 /DNA_ID=CAMNT_0024808041 /DNA_START=21 /DNA_END=227 /DNA_ORIENTATION=+
MRLKMYPSSSAVDLSSSLPALAAKQGSPQNSCGSGSQTCSDVGSVVSTFMIPCGGAGPSLEQPVLAQM